MAQTAPPATKVVTGKVRLSYVHLFEPWSNNPEQTAKYSTVILVPKSDTTTIKKIRAAIEAAKEVGKTTKFNGSVPKNLKTTFRDGDEEADHEKNPEYAGHYFMTVSSSQKPGVVDQNVDPILDPTEVYSGCYARVSINAFPYSAQGSKGISFGLNHVQFLADGEPLGGVRTRPEDEFSAVGDDELI